MVKMLILRSKLYRYAHRNQRERIQNSLERIWAYLIISLRCFGLFGKTSIIYPGLVYGNTFQDSSTVAYFLALFESSLLISR
mgnify:CR=1 FL=1